MRLRDEVAKDAIDRNRRAFGALEQVCEAVVLLVADGDLAEQAWFQDRQRDHVVLDEAWRVLPLEHRGELLRIGAPLRYPVGRFRRAEEKICSAEKRSDSREHESQPMERKDSNVPDGQRQDHRKREQHEQEGPQKRGNEWPDEPDERACFDCHRHRVDSDDAAVVDAQSVRGEQSHDAPTTNARWMRASSPIQPTNCSMAPSSA